MPARSSAALMATPPRSAAEKSLSEPSSRPIGVRAPLTMTERDMAASRGGPPTVATAGSVPPYHEGGRGVHLPPRIGRGPPHGHQRDEGLRGAGRRMIGEARETRRPGTEQIGNP